MAHATTRHRSALARLLQQHAASLARHVADAVEGREKSVHRARVASRRGREVLPIIAEIVSDDAAADLRRDLESVTDALGRVREMDVSLKVLADQGRTHNWQRAYVDYMRKRLEAKRHRRGRKMEKQLAQIDAARLERDAAMLSTIVDRESSSVAWRDALQARLRRRAQTLSRSLHNAGLIYAPEALHAVRIAAKKLRYSLELARDAAGAELGRNIHTLYEAQNQLGALHDLQVLQSLVNAAASTSNSAMTRGLSAMGADIEAACRVQHAAFLALRPRLMAVALDIRERAAARQLQRQRRRLARARMRTPQASPSRRRVSA